MVRLLQGTFEVMGITPQALHTVVRAVTALAIFITFGFVLQKCDVEPTPGQPTTADLRKEFLKVPIMEGSSSVDQWSNFNRGGVIAVVGHFDVNAPPSSVISFYLNVLPHQGWTLADSSESALFSPKIKFCKDEISLIVDAMGGGQSSIYYLGVHWTASPKQRTYCPGHRKSSSL